MRELINLYMKCLSDIRYFHSIIGKTLTTPLKTVFLKCICVLTNTTNSDKIHKHMSFNTCAAHVNKNMSECNDNDIYTNKITGHSV